MKSKKYLRFSMPMQLLTQGQWWSMRKTQLLQTEQWWVRTGLTKSHLEHFLSQKVYRSLTVLFRYLRIFFIWADTPSYLSP